MGVKRVEELTEEEVGKLTDEQMKTLKETGEIDLPDETPAGQKPPTDGTGDDTPPPGVTGEEGKEGKQETPPAKPQISLEEVLKENDRLRRESEGRLRDLIELRQKVKEQLPQKPVETPKNPFEDVLKDLEDDNFVEAPRFKTFAQRVLEYIGSKEQDFNKAVEQRVQQMELEKQIARVEASRKRAEGNHTDYLEKVSNFYKGLSPLEAQLINQELAKSQDPAEELYKLATRLSVLKQEETLQQAQRKQSPKILGGSGGGVPFTLTPEKLLKMSDEEIAKLEKEHPEQLRELHQRMGEA